MANNLTVGLKGMHPILVRRLLLEISMACRLSLLVKSEQRREFLESDSVLPWEIPHGGTFSKWMRNDYEANQYDLKLRSENSQ